jgi:hypothetical protein
MTDSAANFIDDQSQILSLGLPIYITNVLPSSVTSSIGPYDYAAPDLSARSLLLEAIAISLKRPPADGLKRGEAWKETH